MNYGPCKACPNAVAAWSLSENARVLLPESALLCPDHLRLLIQRRADAAARAERAANRIFCACGNEMYLAGRASCAACTTCVEVVGRTTEVTPVSLRIPEDWYSAKSCDEPDCAAKMVYHYPAAGRTICAKHGAAPEPEDAHA